jgi:hypothetical protein
MLKRMVNGILFALSLTAVCSLAREIPVLGNTQECRRGCFEAAKGLFPEHLPERVKEA